MTSKKKTARLAPKGWRPDTRTLRDYLLVLSGSNSKLTLRMLESKTGIGDVHQLRYLDHMKTRTWIGAIKEGSKRWVWIESRGRRAYDKLTAFLDFAHGPGVFADHLGFGKSPRQAIEEAIRQREQGRAKTRKELEARLFEERSP